jgi:hypothetical protein
LPSSTARTRSRQDTTFLGGRNVGWRGTLSHCPSAAAPELALALGFDIDAAFEALEGKEE